MEAQLSTFFTALLAIAAGVVTIGGAWTVISKLFIEPRKTSDRSVEERLRHHDECLARDKAILEKVEEANNLLMKGQLQIMNHMADGNHLDQLKQARDDMQEFLIRR